MNYIIGTTSGTFYHCFTGFNQEEFDLWIKEYNEELIHELVTGEEVSIKFEEHEVIEIIDI